jgi:hypothetical protein
VGLAPAGGEVRCCLGATVTNFTTDCLHWTGVGTERSGRNWGAIRLAEKSRSSDRGQGIQSDGILSRRRLEGAIGYDPSAEPAQAEDENCGVSRSSKLSALSAHGQHL